MSFNRKNYYESFELSKHDRDYYEINKTRYVEQPSSNFIEDIMSYEDAAVMHEQVASISQEERDIIKSHLHLLTNKQRDIYDLLCQGMKQEDIAKQLGCSQGTVSMTLNGTIDYKRGKRYGGIIKKLKKAIGE